MYISINENTTATYNLSNNAFCTIKCREHNVIVTFKTNQKLGTNLCVPVHTQDNTEYYSWVSSN